MKKYLLATLLLSIISSSINAQQVWVSLFTDSSKTFIPKDMMTDANGNTYITGYTNQPTEYYRNHFYVQMVSADGKTKWTKTFPGFSYDSTDAGIAIIADNKGSIYVAGTRADTICNVCTVSQKYSNIFVIKYDTLGNMLWIYRAQRPDSTQQYVTDIALSATGMPYLTGYEQKYNSQTGRYSSRLIAIRLMKTGVANWQKYVPGAAAGYGIAVDANNNAAIAATDINDYQLQHNMVVKLNAAGNVVFKSVFSEPNKNGRNIFVSTDAAGNIYANGNNDTIAFFNNPHVITFKYSPAGNLLWYKREKDNTYTGRNLFGAFRLDSLADIYVVCYVHLSSINDDWVLTKYKSNGVQQFSTQNGSSSGGEDRPCGIALDTKGYIYVTGSYSSPLKYVDYGYATVQYSPAGTVLNTAIYPDKSNKSSNFPIGIGIDKYNNVYVSGTSARLIANNTTKSYLATVKYAAAQQIFTSSSFKMQNSSFKIYPNPVSDFLHIDDNSNGDISVNIYTAKGDKVITRIFSNGEQRRINVSALLPGIYLIGITYANGSTVNSKFLKN